jgi:Rha family phage regulatory protein
MDRKTCNICNVEKDTSEFHKDKSKKGGIRNQCIPCYKDRYLNKKELVKTGTDLISIIDNRPMTTSLIVSEKFEKEHCDVLKAIRNLEFPEGKEDYRLGNFAESVYLNEQGKEQPCYLMTKKGFSLLAFGFTGSKAMEWKIKYIDEFERMEEYIRSEDKLKKESYELRDRKNDTDYHLAELKKISTGINKLIEDNQESSNRLEKKIDNHDIWLNDLTKKFDNMQKKRHPKEKQKRIWYDYLWHGVPVHLKGRCPLCKDQYLLKISNGLSLFSNGNPDYEKTVISGNIEWHHCHRNEDRQYYDVLPICIECHNKVDRSDSLSNKTIKRDSLLTRYDAILEELEYYRRIKNKNQIQLL